MRDWPEEEDEVGETDPGPDRHNLEGKAAAGRQGKARRQGVWNPASLSGCWTFSDFLMPTTNPAERCNRPTSYLCAGGGQFCGREGGERHTR